MSDVRVRRALRDLDEARSKQKWAKLAVAGCVTVVVAILTGWVSMITWGLSDAGTPGVDKGPTVFALGIGLLVLSVAATPLTGAAVRFLADMSDEKRQAEYDYEDAVLEAAA